MIAQMQRSNTITCISLLWPQFYTEETGRDGEVKYVGLAKNHEN